MSQTAARPAVPLGVIAFVVLACGGLVAFGQAGSIFDADEALHLIAVGLVRRGQRPYADFFYWHEPVYPYFAATWTFLAGESWRSLRLLSSLLSGITAILVAHYTLRRVDDPRWRGWCAASAVAVFVLSAMVLKFGTIGHNYALGLCLSVAAVTAASSALNTNRVQWYFAAGGLAGAAVATSLLLCVLPPILLVWLLKNEPALDRTRRTVAFLVGTIPPFGLLGWLWAHAPDRAFFDLWTYHVSYRLAADDVFVEQSRTLAAWLSSAQALTVLLLGVVGLTAGRRDPTLGSEARRELDLCGWLIVGIALFVATAHPPALQHYFIYCMPFLAYAAAVGVRVLGTRVWPKAQPVWIVGALALPFFLGLAQTMHTQHLLRADWAVEEARARDVESVGAPERSLYTPDMFAYVAARESPPPGLENPWASEIAVSADRASQLSITLARDRDADVESGRYDVLLLPADDVRLDATRARYRHLRPSTRGFLLLWDRR